MRCKTFSNFVSVFISVLVCLNFLSVFSLANNTEINVFVDGEQLVMDQPPVIIDGRTLVPLRAIFDALNISVNWDEDTKTVYANNSYKNMTLQIGGDTATINDELVELDVPAKIVGSRTLVPVRFIASSFGANVEWDGDSRTVFINSSQEGIASENSISTKEYVSNIDQMIDVGDDFVALIKPDRSLWMWGGNEFQQISTEYPSAIFAPIKIRDGVKKVSCGDNHILILNTNSELTSQGDNSYYQCSNVAFGEVVLNNVADIATGINHSVALSENGDVYVWGSNSKGQLGFLTSNVKTIEFPQKILQGAKAIYAFDNFTVVVLASGEILYMGEIDFYNESGKKIQLKNFDSSVEVSRIYSFGTVENFSVSEYQISYSEHDKQKIYRRFVSFNEKLNADAFVIAKDVYLYDGKIYGGYETVAGAKTAIGVEDCIIDEVLYATMLKCGSMVAVLEDTSLWTWGTHKNGTLGTGKNTGVRNPNILYERLCEDVELEDDKQVSVTLLSATVTNESCDIMLKFNDSDGNVVRPIGIVEVALNDDYGIELIKDNVFSIIDKSYSDDCAIISIPYRYIQTATSRTGKIKVNFKDAFIRAESNVEIVKNLRFDSNKSSSSSHSSTNSSVNISGSNASYGSSNNALIQMYKSKISQLRNELNSVLLERNVRVYSGGKWIQTYDINKANAIEEEIEYYKELIEMLQ